MRNLFIVAALSALGGSVCAKDVLFNRDVRPILSDKCFGCHGPDPKHREGGVRLDTFEGATAEKKGRRPIVPGNPGASEAVKRMLSKDESEMMPPPESHKTLEPAEIALLQEWIRQGAKYEAHWAYVPIRRPELEKSAAAHPVDQIIGRSLKEAGLKPAPAADRATLLRRASFDLIGLPPTQEEIQAFVNDRRPDAWERQVDRLLGSPHYGERMASFWLDLVRYADTVGYHGDQEWHAWPYRDWVIAALNANMPYDQFVREQLAGDLLPDATIAQKVASGYNRLNMITAEGGAQPAEYRAIYNADRVRNLSDTFLGSTLGCAQCHDHKFDPFTARDFYSMVAFFADVTERDVYNGASKPDDWGPYVAIPNAEQIRQLEQAREELARTQANVTDADAATLDAWAQKIAEGQAVSWRAAQPVAVRSDNDKTTFETAVDGVVKVGGSLIPKEVHTIEIAGSVASIQHLQLELIPSEDGKIGVGNGNIVLTGASLLLAPKDGEPQKLTFARAAASYEQGNFPIAHALNGNPGNGWAIDGHKFFNQGRTGVFSLDKPLALAEGDKLTLELRYESIYGSHYPKQFRVSYAGASEDDPAAGMPLNAATLAAIAKPAAARTDDDRAQLLAGLQAYAEAHVRTLKAKIAKLEATGSDKSLTTVALAKPRVTRILNRGNWMDKTGEIVEPNTPGFLPPMPKVEGRPSRLDLANWIVAPENPLTARALANRLWAIFFGAGISRDLSDLGNQGRWPTHPELLDYLAGYMIDNGWDMKRFVRHVVTSDAYQQSSIPQGDLATTDPYNEQLARQSRFRLHAEAVRDNALALSGLLVDEIGGRNARPYQPAGYYSNLNFPRRTYKADKGDYQYRRGVYTHVQRTFLHPAMRAFDAPSREECTAQRPVSNTPLQALNLLNDPTMVEASRALAQRVMTEGGDSPEARTAWLWRQVLGRAATADELRALNEYHHKRLEEFRARPEAAKEFLSVGDQAPRADLDPVELAAWSATGRLTLNLHETIVRN